MVTDDIWGQASSVCEKDAAPSFLQSQTTDLQDISCGIRRVIRGLLHGWSAWISVFSTVFVNATCHV